MACEWDDINHKKGVVKVIIHQAVESNHPQTSECCLRSCFTLSVADFEGLYELYIHHGNLRVTPHQSQPPRNSWLYVRVLMRPVRVWHGGGGPHLAEQAKLTKLLGVRNIWY